MPTYEYRCKDCGHTFDAYQAFTDDALTECPECSGSLKKLFGNVGIAFKGSGFYKTDSRGSSAKADSGAAKADSKGDSKGDSKSDSSSSTGSTTSESSSSSTSGSGDAKGSGDGSSGTKVASGS